MAGYSTPYAFAHYLGEWANDAAALTELQARKWDSLGTGLGVPRNGMLYYATGAHAFRGYVGGAWTGLVMSAGLTLDAAYDGGGAGLGRAITADSGAVTITVPNASNCAALELTQNDVANNPTALTITNAGTGSSIALAGATRTITSAAGDLSVGVTANDANPYVLRLAATNSGAGTAEIAITAKSDVSVTASAGKLTLHGYNVAGTAVDIDSTLAAGAILIGCSVLASQISIGGAGLRSIFVGHSGAAALQLISQQTMLQGDANDANPHTLTISSANAGAGLAHIDIDAKSAVTVDAGTTSHFYVGYGVAGNTKCGLNIVENPGTYYNAIVWADGSLNGNNVTAGVYALGGVGSNVTALIEATGGSLSNTISVGSQATSTANVEIATNSTGAGTRTVHIGKAGTAADVAEFHVSAKVQDFDLSGGFTVDAGPTAAGQISLDCVGVGNLTSSGALMTVSGVGLTLTSTGAGTLTASSAGTMDIDAVTLTIDCVTLSIDSTDATNLTMTANAAGAKTLTISSLNAGAGAGHLDIDAKSTIDILAGTTFSIDGTGSSNVSATAGDLTVSTITSGTLYLNSAGVWSAQGSDTTTLSMAANAVGAKTLSISAANSGGGAAYLALSDGYKAGSTYATDLVLSDASAEWTAFEAGFGGEVSLLNAINQCAPGTAGWVYAANTDIDIGTEVVHTFNTPDNGEMIGGCFWIFHAVNKDDHTLRTDGYIVADWSEGSTHLSVLRSNPAQVEPTFSLTAVDPGPGTYLTITLSATVTADNWSVKVRRAPIFTEAAA